MTSLVAQGVSKTYLATDGTPLQVLVEASLTLAAGCSTDHHTIVFVAALVTAKPSIGVKWVRKEVEA